MYVSICICAYICIHMYVYMYIYTSHTYTTLRHANDLGCSMTLQAHIPTKDPWKYLWISFQTSCEPCVRGGPQRQTARLCPTRSYMTT